MKVLPQPLQECIDNKDIVTLDKLLKKEIEKGGLQKMHYSQYATIFLPLYMACWQQDFSEAYPVIHKKSLKYYQASNEINLNRIIFEMALNMEKACKGKAEYILATHNKINIEGFTNFLKFAKQEGYTWNSSMSKQDLTLMHLLAERISNDYTSTNSILFIIEKLKEIYPKLNFDQKNKNGLTPLMMVANNGALDALNKLPEDSYNVLLQNSDGRNILHFAFNNDVNGLIKKEANKTTWFWKGLNDVDIQVLINQKDQHGRTPLFYLLQYNKFGQATELISLIKDINTQDKNGENCFLYALRRQKNHHLHIPKRFLESLNKAGFDFNMKTKEGLGIVHYLLQQKAIHYDVFEYLLNCINCDQDRLKKTLETKNRTILQILAQKTRVLTTSGYKIESVFLGVPTLISLYFLTGHSYEGKSGHNGYCCFYSPKSQVSKLKVLTKKGLAPIYQKVEKLKDDTVFQDYSVIRGFEDKVKELAKIIELGIEKDHLNKAVSTKKSMKKKML